MQFTNEELKEILRKHKLWFDGEEGGERAYLGSADLSGADLSGAYLRNANLSGANLSGANLNGANFNGANFSGANFSGAYLRNANLNGAYLRNADLSGAYLNGAILRNANLNGANFSGANLSGANLNGAYLNGANFSGANLSGANLNGAYLRSANVNYPIACPEYGEFIAFKKACRVDNAEKCIVKLKILENAKRLSATSRKCRCDKALVIAIEDIDGTPLDVEAFSPRDIKFKYKKGEIVSVDNFDNNRWNECSTGIHFFITRGEAVDY